MSTSLISKLLFPLQALWHGIAAGWQQVLCDFSNLRRRLFIGQVSDYVVITLDGGLEERDPTPPWYYTLLPIYQPPTTLESLQTALRRIAGDPDVKGLLFLCKSPSLSLAQAQSLTMLFDRFRAWDRQFNPLAPPKPIVFHLEQVTATLFVAACAADRIAITPLTTWDVTGLRSEPLFLRDTLAHVGIAMDVVRVSPWKNAMDRFTHTELSEESRDQYNWLLDSWYADIVDAIANGRKLTAAGVRSLIDGAPWTAAKTLAAGLVDALLYEDQLPTFLGSLLGEQAKPATLKSYAQVRKLLYRYPQPRHEKSIGVISLQGGIMPGTSRDFPLPLPLLGERTAGSATLVQAIRAARNDESLAALILHVDSPGGSALASDLIARELKLLADEKPLVVYLGDVAASGGYYVATPGHKIVAQRATLTGSIGVFSAKPVTGPAFDKINAHRTAIQRGEHAGIYSDASAWSPSERAQVEATVQQMYHEFKLRVSAGRNLPFESLDAICNGRVWTGSQAQEHRLVDQIGDFASALQIACELSALPQDGSVATVNVEPPKQSLLAEAQKNSSESLVTLLSALLFRQWNQLLKGQTLWLLTEELPKVTKL